MSDNSTGHLASIVKRWESVEEEIQERRSYQAEIFAEAKSAGYNAKVLRRFLRERKQKADDVREEERLLEEYRQEFGDYGNTPLGEAAISAFSKTPAWES